MPNTTGHIFIGYDLGLIEDCGILEAYQHILKTVSKNLMYFGLHVHEEESGISHVWLGFSAFEFDGTGTADTGDFLRNLKRSISEIPEFLSYRDAVFLPQLHSAVENDPENVTFNSFDKDHIDSLTYDSLINALKSKPKVMIISV